MSITKTLLAGVAGTVLASGMAVAGEPMKLSTTEMDQVTAGFFSASAFGFPSQVQGLTGSFNQSLFAGGSETNTINSLTNFSAKVSANAGGTSSGEATGFFPFVEYQFIFGGLEAQSVVATEIF
jgi:hypothetical protein